MSRLEDELRIALRRENPGEEFTRRVLAAAHVEASRRSAPWISRWLAAAAACALLAAGGLEYRAYERSRAEGQAAKQQLMIAMRIAGSKLRVAQQKVIGIEQRQRP